MRSADVRFLRRQPFRAAAVLRQLRAAAQGASVSHGLVGLSVVVRSNDSGVWLGRLASVEGACVVLTDARRAWSWTGATDTCGLAVYGPSGGRLPPPVATAMVWGVCEVLVATDAAVARWMAVKEWAV